MSEQELQISQEVKDELRIVLRGCDELLVES